METHLFYHRALVQILVKIKEQHEYKQHSYVAYAWQSCICERDHLQHGICPSVDSAEITAFPAPASNRPVFCAVYVTVSATMPKNTLELSPPPMPNRTRNAATAGFEGVAKNTPATI